MKTITNYIFCFAVICEAEHVQSTQGRSYLSFYPYVVGIAKVQGDRKALPVTPLDRGKHLAVPRARSPVSK